MSSIVPLTLVTDTPTFTDEDIAKVWYGHFKAESDNVIGVFIDFNDGDQYYDGSLFLTKNELYELIQIIEEKETNGTKR